MKFSTPFGEKSFASVGAGKSRFHSFAAEAASVPAGTVTVTATAEIEGTTEAPTRDVEYANANCGR